MCWKCGKPITILPPVARSAVCDECGRDIRVCKNCRFYAPGKHHDCNESSADIVRDKERSNYCDYFSLTQQNGMTAVSSATTKTASPRNAFDALFGASDA